MLSILVFIIILGVLIIVHEFGHLLAAKRSGVRVERFSIGFGPRLFTKKKNETEYSLSVIPLGGYVKLAGDDREEFKGHPDEYLSQPVGKRAKIIFCGPLLNYILGFLFFWLIFFTGYPTLTTKVGDLVQGFGAQEAGIKTGDRITAINGKEIQYWHQLQEIIQKQKSGASVEISVLRKDEKYDFSVQIKSKEVNDIFGEGRSIGMLGIVASDEVVTVRQGFLESFNLALNRTWNLTAITYRALGRMITGRLSMRESVTGPLGIFYITSKATQIGLVAVLQLVAVLSTSLAIFNLLPIPVLDGGHLLFLIIEKLRGRALSLKTERIITQVGLSAIITLALFVTYNDIVRFFGERIADFFSK
ncbi:MAG: RIP metalloprotease RseP [Candidatus Omnitrophota bacterium]|nr:MAG: RIP metalloprotease RseP [Candidatus Omnitrophota bacterium]